MVEPFAVGSKLPYNGLPVFPVRYANDDDGQRRLGLDSRLTFTAPADGVYLVRVSDVRGFSGDNFNYHLIVRRPQPDFTVTVDQRELTIPAGSGQRLAVSVDRVDGFSGEVRVEITGLPPGFFATSPIVIPAGHRIARGAIYAHADAPPPDEAAVKNVSIKASATIAGREVTKTTTGLAKLQLGPKPQVVAWLSIPGEQVRRPGRDASGALDFPPPPELAISPGETITCQLLVERNDFNGILNFEFDNLPHGVIVDNIGLNGIEVLEGHSERTLYLSANRIVASQDRLIQAATKEVGVQVSLPLMLHVRKPAVAAPQARD